MADDVWKIKTHPVYRGDMKNGVAQPDPHADRSIVRHILYLEGYGRTTPYLSTSESREQASRFAQGDEARIYTAIPRSWSPKGVKHRSQKELLNLLVGKGKGDAAWKSAFDVNTAAAYVEASLEHLADFSSRTDLNPDELKELTSMLFV